MGLFKSIVRSISKPFTLKSGDPLLDMYARSNAAKSFDPLLSAIYSTGDRELGRIKSLLTPNMPGIGAAQATADETTADAQRRKQTADRQKRQGVGVGATLLTGSGDAADPSLGGDAGMSS